MDRKTSIEMFKKSVKTRFYLVSSNSNFGRFEGNELQIILVENKHRFLRKLRNRKISNRRAQIHNDGICKMDVSAAGDFGCDFWKNGLSFEWTQIWNLVLHELLLDLILLFVTVITFVHNYTNVMYNEYNIFLYDMVYLKVYIHVACRKVQEGISAFVR